LQAGVLSGAASVGARLVAIENLYGYRPTGGRPLTENLPLAATTSKGATRAVMTAQLLDAHPAWHRPARFRSFYNPATGEHITYTVVAEISTAMAWPRHRVTITPAWALADPQRESAE